ncbi:hypothetical protein ACQR2B_31030 [Bradyrhizobium oligotrophicum]|uniref:hypothetical protein n=1 Tax=Bradyrhizobium TaxID=374 RepID=UPI003EB94AEF
MKIKVLGAEIGRQCIGGDPNSYEWRVSYVPPWGGLAHLIVGSGETDWAAGAITIAEWRLGLTPLAASQHRPC